MSLKKIVGLDIASSSLRAIEATLKDGVIVKITNIAVMPLQTQVIREGNIISESALYRAVKQMWETNKIKTKDVAISLNGQSVLTRLKDGLQEQKNQETFDFLLKTQMADSILAGVNNYYLSSTILDKYYDPKKQVVLCDALVVGIEKKNLDPIVNALENAGLRVRGAEIAPLAISRSVIKTEEDAAKRYASIDIGGDLTTIIIHKDGFPEYIRNITGISGNAINQRIAEELGVNIKRAEEEKFKALGKANQLASTSTNVFSQGVTTEGLEAGSEEAERAEYVNQIVSQEISTAIRHIKDTLTDAITFTDLIDSPVDEVKLSGGGANINTFASRLENEIGIKTSFAEPFAGVEFDKETVKKMEQMNVKPHEFATAFGIIFGGRY